MLSVTPRLILAEFAKRGIQCRQIESNSPKVFLEYVGKDGRRRYISGTVSDKTSAVACRLADDKLTTAALAQRIGVPVPLTMVCHSSDEGASFLAQHKKVVVKPLDSSHGYGVTVGIDSVEQLARAIEHAREFSETVLLQQMVEGRDLRLLFIGGEFVAAMHRKPATVTGDGQHTIKELIETVNQDLERGEGYERKYTRIPLPIAESFLGARFSEVPPAGEEVQVIGTANIGSGGTAHDITDNVPAALVEQGKKVVAELGIGVSGVDFIADGDNAYLIEVNSSPSFGLHAYPHEGNSRDVTAVFVDWLLADNADQVAYES